MRLNKYLVLILIFLGLSPEIGVSGGLRDSSKLGLFLREEFATNQNQDWMFYEQRYNAHVDWLKAKKKQIKSTESFLKFVFYRTHKIFLHDYKNFASFNEIFSDNGKYDCVTGTALYALILDELGYRYEIRETEYHAYLLVHEAGHTYLFESTDGESGFSSDAEEIAMRKKKVINEAIDYNTQLAMSAVATKRPGASDIRMTIIDASITITQLAGLQFYNQALSCYNQEEYRDAYQFIIVAQGIYPSDRIKRAASLMFAIAFSD